VAYYSLDGAFPVQSYMKEIYIGIISFIASIVCFNFLKYVAGVNTIKEMPPISIENEYTTNY